jgi:hypothetical protein
MSIPRRTRLILAAGIVGLWLALSACTCGNLITITPAGEPEPSPTVVIATRTPAPVPTIDPEALPVIPGEPGQSFELELTEEDLADLLSGQTFSSDQATIDDVRVQLMPGAIVTRFRATQPSLGVTADVILRGVPVVVDGTVYFRVDSVDLEGPMPGFARLIARGAIERAIGEYSTQHGIPLRIAEVEVDEVEALAGVLRITGQRR